MISFGLTQKGDYVTRALIGIGAFKDVYLLEHVHQEEGCTYQKARTVKKKKKKEGGDWNQILFIQGN